MTFINAKWADAAQTTITATRDDGVAVSFLADPANADYRLIIQGRAASDTLDAISPVIIAAYEPPAVTADAVRAEAQRRIYTAYPQWMQANMTARSVELLRMGEGNWNVPEQAEADAMDAVWTWIKSVRAASNALEADPPADYADDTHWPAMPGAS